MYIERFKFSCPRCKKLGIITDVLLNPELMILRGHCLACDMTSAYKAVDMSMLQAEYEVLSDDLGEEGRHTGNSDPWSVLRFNLGGV
jgi:hypothetical protein